MKGSGFALDNQARVTARLGGFPIFEHLALANRKVQHSDF